MPNTNQKLNIICLSNQLWDFPNWTNKKHVMTRLASQGHNVIFVDPPINTGKVFFTQIRRGLWNLARLLTQIKKDKTGALVYTPLNVIPFPKVTSSLHIKKIKTLSKKIFDPKIKTVLWVYHVQIPELKKYLDKLHFDVLVYDCVDNYEGFPANSAFYSATVPKSLVISQEKMLAERANVVFATAPALVDKMKRYNKNVHFTPNVGDYEKFKSPEKYKDQIPQDLLLVKRPRVGFTGSLDEYKFDARLMRKTAQDNPDMSFVLIGQIALKDKNTGLEALGLSDLPNVHFLGFRPFENLHKYFAGFDAFIIPYQLNDYTVGGCFPIKFHDALAGGLPTVVTDLPSYYPFSNVSYISKTYDDFSYNVRKAVEEDSQEKITARKRIAQENSWEGKVQKLLELISIATRTIE